MILFTVGGDTMYLRGGNHRGFNALGAPHCVFDEVMIMFTVGGDAMYLRG